MIWIFAKLHSMFGNFSFNLWYMLAECIGKNSDSGFRESFVPIYQQVYLEEFN
jgi:hypothetical protein